MPDDEPLLPRLRHALQATLADDDDPDLSGAVLTGYVVIAEWAATDGDRWLTKTAGDLNDNGPAIWTVKGWLYHDTAQRDADANDDQGEGDDPL